MHSRSEDDFKRLEAMRTHTWSYFQLHAQQRLSVFNFYIVLAGALTTGLVASLPKADQHAALPIALGSLLIFFSFVFSRLDVRNRSLIRNAERGLREIESSWAAERGEKVTLLGAAVFSRDETHVQAATKRNAFVSLFSSHPSFSDCFRFTFASFAILGVGSIVYAVVKG